MRSFCFKSVVAVVALSFEFVVVDVVVVEALPMDTVVFVFVVVLFAFFRLSAVRTRPTST